MVRRIENFMIASRTQWPINQPSQSPTRSEIICKPCTKCKVNEHEIVQCHPLSNRICVLESNLPSCNKFSYADIQAAVSLQFLVRLNRIDINDYQNLSEYINNITARPSFSA